MGIRLAPVEHYDEADSLIAAGNSFMATGEHACSDMSATEAYLHAIGSYLGAVAHSTQGLLKVQVG